MAVNSVRIIGRAQANVWRFPAHWDRGGRLGAVCARVGRRSDVWRSQLPVPPDLACGGGLPLDHLRDAILQITLKNVALKLRGPTLYPFKGVASGKTRHVHSTITTTLQTPPPSVPQPHPPLPRALLPRRSANLTEQLG